jgi:multidrug resistance efflux pump
MAWRRNRVTGGIKILGAALLFASFVVPAQMLGQSSSFAAPGRVEGAGAPMSIGAAAGGIIGEVLVREGNRVQAGQTLVKLACRPLEADMHAREAHLAAAQATYDRFRNGSRPDEIAVGEAVLGFAQARLDEAQKTLQRTESLQEGVTVTTARVLEVQRDARIAGAQLEEARARLSLLRAGAREEDIREAKALRDAAAADLDGGRARFDQCSVRAPVDGVVLDVLVNPGQFLSLAVPQPLLHIVPDGQSRVRAEIDLHDLPRVCVQQRAAVVADTFPNPAIQAQVSSISPAVSPRSLATAGTAAATTPADSRSKDVVAVVLTVDRGAPTLPIGLPVTVRFDVCPSKS